MKPDPWSLTFAYLWYIDTPQYDIVVRIDRSRLDKGIPSFFG
jgi:hypothetical protein